eukprot:4934039-Pyramimonas_sp.AAC.1
MIHSQHICTDAICTSTRNIPTAPGKIITGPHLELDARVAQLVAVEAKDHAPVEAPAAVRGKEVSVSPLDLLVRGALLVDALRTPPRYSKRTLFRGLSRAKDYKTL